MLASMGNPLSDQEVKDIMKESGSTDSISYAAFTKLLGIGIKQSRETDPEEEMQDAFRLFDRDGDGTIGPKDMKDALKMFGVTLTDREVDQVRRDSPTRRHAKRRRTRALTRLSTYIHTRTRPLLGARELTRTPAPLVVSVDRGGDAVVVAHRVVRRFQARDGGESWVVGILNVEPIYDMRFDYCGAAKRDEDTACEYSTTASARGMHERERSSSCTYLRSGQGIS